MAKAAQPSSTSGDAESQRQVMNARCAALLEAQRAAFRRRVELRKEAILAATAKAKAAGTLPTHEVSAAAGDRDDPMRSSTGAELPANDVQNATDSHPGPSSLPRAYTKCALLLWPCIQFHSILYVYYSLIFAVPSQVTPMADMKRENSFMARHLIHFSVRDHSDVLVHQAVAYLRHAGVFINRSLFLTTTGLCLYWRSFCSISRDWTRIFLLHLYSLASLFNCFFEQRTTPSTSEPSGPKSRADPPSGFIFRRRFSFSFAGWICITLFLSSFTRVGGVRVASDATEAGSQELLATATSGGRLLSTAKKRAFHRAQRRAQVAGGTFYKGRWCTARSLHVRGVDASADARAPRPGTFRTWQQNPKVLDLNIISWNSSGLGAAVLPEFLLWLGQLPQESRPNIVLIQESHWRFTSEYRHGNWLAYHNGVSEGSADRYAGLLTLIRVPGVSPEQVRVHNVLQGRLTHVRIDFPTGNVDILHVYQHAASTDPSRTIKDKRRRLFNRLDTLIHSMPGRNLLVVGGDFNQPLPCASPYTGSAICVPSPTHPDHCREGNTLLHIAERHDLVALNTFHCRPSFTFQHCASRTQIDFIFVRSGDAFGRAKRSRPLYDSSLMAWRDTKHHPLIAELSLPRHWWPAQTRSIRYDRAALVQSYNLQTPQYQTFAEATVRHFADIKLGSYDDMRDQLMICCAEHFPATKSRVPQPWNHPSLSGYIKRMWAHYKLSRLYQRRESFDIPTCFAQWHHASRFQAMHREAKRHGRLVKRERYLNQIQQAEEAAASHNAFVLYRIVRRLAPKQRFQTVQIRSDDGSILSHDQELGLLRSHFEKVWHKPSDWCCPVLRSRSTLEAGVMEPGIYAPDLAQLKCSARSIQPYKALPSTHPAAPAFKAVTEYFGDRVVDWMSGDGRPCMPQSWNLTHVALIPKPGKKHGAISSLRPIGLQDPIAKGYVKVLADDLKPYAMSYL